MSGHSSCKRASTHMHERDVKEACKEWAVSFRHLLRNILCSFESQFGWPTSHHVMPKVLVLQASGVIWCDNSWHYLLGAWRFLAERDLVTRWKLPAEKRHGTNQMLEEEKEAEKVEPSRMCLGLPAPETYNNLINNPNNLRTCAFGNLNLSMNGSFRWTCSKFWNDSGLEDLTDF